MSELEETLFEIDIDAETVKAIGVELDVTVENLKIYVNDVDINRTMKISSVKIVKVL